MIKNKESNVCDRTTTRQTLRSCIFQILPLQLLFHWVIIFFLRESRNIFSFFKKNQSCRDAKYEHLLLKLYETSSFNLWVWSYLKAWSRMMKNENKFESSPWHQGQQQRHARNSLCDLKCLSYLLYISLNQIRWRTSLKVLDPLYYCNIKSITLEVGGGMAGVR